jgi:hypothetical protein
VIEPVHPLKRSEPHVFEGLPGSALSDQFGLVFDTAVTTAEPLDSAECAVLSVYTENNGCDRTEEIPTDMLLKMGGQMGQLL